MKPIAWATIIFIIIAMISAGFLFIFSFERNLFLNSDNIKLILLGASITTPIWLINSVVAIEFAGAGKNNNENLNRAVMVGSVFSILTIYFPILLGLYFTISIRFAVAILLVLEAIYLISGLLGRKSKVEKAGGAPRT